MCDQLSRPPDYLFAAVSTTGSILSCSRRLRERFPDVGVIAVDAVGSVIFEGPPDRREMPGIGAGRVPELLAPEEIFPDRGDRYLDLVYDDAWLAKLQHRDLGAAE